MNRICFHEKLQWGDVVGYWSAGKLEMRPIEEQQGSQIPSNG
jgi:hypothetical protein